MIQMSLGGTAHSQNKTVHRRHQLMGDIIVMLIKLIPNILLYFANFKKFEMQYLLYIKSSIMDNRLYIIQLSLNTNIVSGHSFFHSYLFCVVCVCTYVAVRITSRNSFSSSTTWVPESDSDCQAWQQEPLPAEPPYQPRLLTFLMTQAS